MSAFHYTPAKLEQRIAPFTVGGTTINQLAWCDLVLLPETQDGFLHVSMHLQLIPYAYLPCPDGTEPATWDTWGAVPKSLNGVGPYRTREWMLTTDNDTYVEVPTDSADPNFGVIRAQLRYHGQAYIDYLLSAEYPGRVMPQSTFMSYVRDNCPSVMGNVLRYHIRMADLMGYFAYDSAAS